MLVYPAVTSSRVCFRRGFQLFQCSAPCSLDFLSHDDLHQKVHSIQVWRVRWPDVLAPKPTKQFFDAIVEREERTGAPVLLKRETTIAEVLRGPHVSYVLKVALILTFRSMKISEVFPVLQIPAQTITEAGKSL